VSTLDRSLRIVSTLGLAILLATHPVSAQKERKSSEPTLTADNAPAVIHELSHTWRIDAEGRGERLDAGRVTIREAGALEAWGHIYINYIAEREVVELRSLVVTKADGRLVRLDESSLKDLPTQESGTFDAPNFSDSRVKHITVPALAVGDTLSYEIAVRQVVPLAKGHFWTEQSFVRDAIVERESFDIDWPSSLPLAVKVNSAVGVEDQTVRAEAGRSRRRWTHQNLTLGESERKTLSKLLRKFSVGHGPSPDIQVSTFKSWNEVAQWYHDLSVVAEAPATAVTTRAKALTGNVSSPLDRVAALHKFVSQNVRYVALAFGDGRYQPRAASLVLSTEYGDCKDKHTLLSALAREVGVEVRPVLIGSRRDLDPDFPSPAQFDHVISLATVPGRTALWIDGTVNGGRLDGLFTQLRDKQALLVAPDGTGALVRTPEHADDTQRIRVEVKASYAESGTWRVRCRRTLTGDVEVLFRNLFLRADVQSRSRFAQEQAKEDGLKGTITVLNLTSADPHDLGLPFWYEYEVETNYTTPMNPESWTLWLGPIVETTVNAQLQVPDDLKIKPALAVALEHPFGSYKSTYEVSKGLVRLERRLTTKVKAVSTAQLGAYRAFRKAVDADYRQTFAVDAIAVTAKPADAATTEELLSAAEKAEKSRDFQTAVTLLRRAAEKSPSHGMLWNRLGRDLDALGKLDEAVEAYNKQIVVNPYHEYAYNNRGLVEWRQGKLDAAEKSFLKQIEVVPLDKYAHTNLGLLKLEQGRHEEALAALERGIAITPKDTRALMGIARTYLALKREDDAVAAFGRVVEAAPNPGTWNNSAWWLADAGVKLDVALDYAQKAVASATAVMKGRSLEGVKREQLGAVVALGSFWDTLGWVHFRRGDLPKALSYLQAAWALAQQGIMAEHVGEVREGMGRKDEAIRAYRWAVIADPKPVEAAGKRLAALGQAGDTPTSRGAMQSDLIAQRTVPLPKLAGARGTSEYLLLVDGTGKIVDARFASGDAALKPVAAKFIGLATGFKAPEGAELTLLRRAAVTCTDKGACSAVLYRPIDVRSIE
jgi:tetratricopeptide (TPR) repeat protein